MFERLIEVGRPEGWVGEDELDAIDMMELDELLGPPGTIEPEPRVRLAPEEWPWGSAPPCRESAVGLDAATADPGAPDDPARF